MEEIEKIICAGERISPEDLHFRNREDHIKETRQIIMYFARKIDPLMSWKNIAEYFGLEHATAMHAYKIIISRTEIYRTYRERINKYEKKLSGINPFIILFANNEVFQENDFYPELINQ